MRMTQCPTISGTKWRGVAKKHLVDCTIIIIAKAKEDLQAQLRPFSRRVYNNYQASVSRVKAAERTA